MLLGLALAVAYTGSLYMRPFGRHRRCGGTGKRRQQLQPVGQRARAAAATAAPSSGSRTGHRVVRSVIAYRQDR